MIRDSNFWDILSKRHCVRSFNSEKQVSDENIKKILEAAQMAPSAGNMQDWHFEVIKDKKVVTEIAQACAGQSFITQAPVVIVVCADLKKAAEYYGQRGVNLYSIQDTAAATQNLFLAVTALGLATCWIGAFDENEIKKILNLKLNLRPVVVMPVGHEG